MKPSYHVSLTDGTFDRRSTPQSASIGNDDQPTSEGEVLLVLDRTKPGQAPERLQFAVRAYNGHPFADLRMYYLKTRDGVWMPTKNGLTIRQREIEIFEEAVQRAAKLLGGSQ